ncbi:BNR repeat domain protein [Minicystis rosea]|nr:BNR repeat domain protein [Minicystis rosea]
MKAIVRGTHPSDAGKSQSHRTFPSLVEDGLRRAAEGPVIGISRKLGMMPFASRASSTAATLLVAALAVLIGGCNAVPPDAIRGPKKIVAGPGGACALWDGAPMRCWGETPYEPSDSEERRFASPSSVPDASDVALESSSRWYAGPGCVIERDGALACARAIIEGGRLLPAIRSAPSMRDVHAPAVAGARVCAIARGEGEQDASVWCRDRLGDAGEKTPPEDLWKRERNARMQDERGWKRVDLGDVASIALGPKRLCALLRSGRVRCTESPGAEARDIEGITDAVQLVVGNDFGCARDARGGVRCFGEGAQGQLGDGDAGPRAEARPVPLSAPATNLVAGHQRACAIVNGAPMCWGLLRLQGALPAVVARTPQRLADIGDLEQLALGRNFACATRRTDGTVWCWGYDADGALGDGSILPGASCSREGISATSEERERPAGPTAVRTGAAGSHPAWRLPLAFAAALLVLTPLASLLALARTSIRRRHITSRGARLAIYTNAIVAASLVPIAVSRVLPSALAWWGEGLHHSHNLRFAITTLGPDIALATTIVGFVRLCAAPAEHLHAAAQRGAAWLVACTGPLLFLVTMCSTDVNHGAREELVYLVRDAALRTDPFFTVRGWATALWLLLAALDGIIVLAWTKSPSRPSEPANAR